VKDQHNAQLQRNNPAGRQDAPVQVQSDAAVIVGGEDTGSFSPLAGALPFALEGGLVYQVRMQRASLSALGLPVSEDGLAGWVNVDLLVADDGTPQGVRLHEDAFDSGTLNSFE